MKWRTGRRVHRMLHDERGEFFPLLDRGIDSHDNWPSIQGRHIGWIECQVFCCVWRRDWGNKHIQTCVSGRMMDFDEIKRKLEFYFGEVL